jgi:hypothetical protein
MWSRHVGAATWAALALIGVASGCGGGANNGSGGLTSDEHAALDLATGSYLSQVDRGGKKAASTAYAACREAAGDYQIVHRLLFARAFAKSVQFSNGKRKRKADLRSMCLVGLAFASGPSG